MPRGFTIELIINGLKFNLLRVADVDCSMKWCKYTFDEDTVAKLLSSADCTVVVTKFYVKGTMEMEYKCKDFVEIVKTLSEEE
jgi:hypothetical protein